MFIRFKLDISGETSMTHDEGLSSAFRLTVPFAIEILNTCEVHAALVSLTFSLILCLAFKWLLWTSLESLAALDFS